MKQQDRPDAKRRFVVQKSHYLEKFSDAHLEAWKRLELRKRGAKKGLSSQAVNFKSEKIAEKNQKKQPRATVCYLS